MKVLTFLPRFDLCGIGYTFTCVAMTCATPHHRLKLISEPRFAARGDLCARHVLQERSAPWQELV